ncbi:MAG: Hpt domain-containing protein [Lachnospiraceae bacterium]|nr:Hpt domain-containing protein [Lachnospiraceae bacterium]
MLTIEALKDFGADTADGVGRCFGNADFYMNLVKTVPTEKKFDELAGALSVNDLDKAFEYAHALKGVLANLSLTPIAEPMTAITEHLRGREQMDYAPLMDAVMEKREELRKICEG